MDKATLEKLICELEYEYKKVQDKINVLGLSCEKPIDMEDVIKLSNIRYCKEFIKGKLD